MSKYADEGSIAHALAAMALREGKDAAAYIGRVIECEDYEHSKLGPSGAHRWMVCLGSVVLEGKQAFVPRKFSDSVTDEMAADVQVYLDNVRRYTEGSPILIEQSLDISHLLGDGQGGTGDVCSLVGDELQVHDLKFGRGVDVSAHDNPQLKLYGLGFLPIAELLGDVKRFRGVIHQPRTVRAPKEWDCSIDELRAFAETVKKSVAGVNYVLEEAASGHSIDSFLIAGDHCTFCKAAATCPKLSRQVSKDVFDAFEAIGNPHETVKPRVVATQDDKALGAFLKKVDMIEDWCTQVRAEVERRLFAGQTVPGWKLVAGKKGNRAWIDETAAEAALRATKVPIDLILPRVLISPTQAQNVLKKDHPKHWAKLSAHISQKDGKPHVAPVSDPRPELPSTLDKFEAIGNAGSALT